MLISNRWQSKAAFLLALGITSTAVVPILSSTPAVANSQSYKVAQLSPSSSITIPAGTIIPVRYDKGKRILVTPKETASVTLTVAQAVRSARGTIAIPAGSQIAGELRPARGGTRFVAEELILRNSRQRLPIAATSEVITETETISEKTNPNFLRGAVIGAAAGAVLTEIFGDIDLGAVLGGAAAGALGEAILGRRKEKEVEVVVVNPETDLDLTLQEDFVPRTAS